MQSKMLIGSLTHLTNHSVRVVLLTVRGQTGMPSKDGSCTTVSFDYCYTKAGEASQEPDALVALVMVDSKTGYLGCVPMNSKNQFDFATKEIIAFCQTLGYDDVMLRCDNEPSVLQLQRLVVQAGKQMGLRTQACTPSAYEHGNALAENGIQRIRGLAGSIMHGLQMKLGATVSTSHALWTWCMRHSAWVLSTYNPHQGLTAYEVVMESPTQARFVSTQARFVSMVNQHLALQNHP